MDNLINKLPKIVINTKNNHLLEPVIYLTAWGKWCISYQDILEYDDTNIKFNEFSVVIEPDNELVRIEDTIGSFNEYVGNAPTFNDAIDMIVDYAYKNYNVK